MKIVIDIPEEIYERCRKYELHCGEAEVLEGVVANGTPIPKGHSFIAICDSEFPITEEIKQDLKNTVFVGNEDCRYCFDMTEIIEAERIEHKFEPKTDDRSRILRAVGRYIQTQAEENGLSALGVNGTVYYTEDVLQELDALIKEEEGTT